MKSRALLLALGCFTLASVSEAAKPRTPPYAEATIKDRTGAKIGTASFSETKDGLKVKVSVAGIAPGKHGIHVHEKGTCAGPDYASAGSHLSVKDQKHGLDHSKPHGGDFPNLEVDANGTGTLEFVNPGLTIGTATSKKASVLQTGGASIVIHEKEDDQKTDPSGNSGDRIACGVIGATDTLTQ